MTDTEIVKSIAAGNREWFSELVSRYDAAIRRYIKRRCGQYVVDDIMQEFWLKVFRNCGQYDENRQVKPWLYTIAATCGIDFARRVANRVNQNLGDTDIFCGTNAENPLDNASRNDIIEQIRGRVQLLPTNYRQVITLTYLEGLTQSEAADIIGVPVGTVKSRMNKAFEKLRNNIGA